MTGSSTSHSEYDVARSRSQTVFGVSVATIVLSTVFVFFRMVSRIGIVKRVQVDDYFILLAWVRIDVTILGAQDWEY